MKSSSLFIVLLICSCNQIGCSHFESYKYSSDERTQPSRVFHHKFANIVIDATSEEEVRSILGSPTVEYGCGVGYIQWFFDNGEIYEINSLCKPQKGRPIGIMLPNWRVRWHTCNSKTAKCEIAKIEFLSVRRADMTYKIEVWPLEHPTSFLSVGDGDCLVLDRDSFLRSGFEKVEESLCVCVRRTGRDDVRGMSTKRFVIYKTGADSCDIIIE